MNYFRDVIEDAITSSFTDVHKRESPTLIVDNPSSIIKIETSGDHKPTSNLLKYDAAKKEENAKYAPFPLELFQPYITALNLTDRDIIVARDIADQVFSRAGFSSIVGGSAQTGLTLISREKHVHKNHSFKVVFFPSPEVNPLAPKRRGQSGLLFIHDAQWTPPSKAMIIFTRVKKRGGTRWRQCGLYEFKRCNLMDMNIFQSQNDDWKKAWVSMLQAVKWGHKGLVEMILRRRLGRRPSVDEVSLGIQDRVFEGHEAERDATAAYENGDKAIVVWGVQCVGYGTKLARYAARFTEAERCRKSERPTRRPHEEVQKVIKEIAED